MKVFANNGAMKHNEIWILNSSLQAPRQVFSFLIITRPESARFLTEEPMTNHWQHWLYLSPGERVRRTLPSDVFYLYFQFNFFLYIYITRICEMYVYIYLQCTYFVLWCEARHHVGGYHMQHYETAYHVIFSELNIPVLTALVDSAKPFNCLYLYSGL